MRKISKQLNYKNLRYLLDSEELILHNNHVILMLRGQIQAFIKLLEISSVNSCKLRYKNKIKLG